MKTGLSAMPVAFPLIFLVGYLVFYHPEWLLIPMFISILLPQLAANVGGIPNLQIHEVLIPVMFVAMLMRSIVRKDVSFNRIPTSLALLFLVGVATFMKRPALPGSLMGTSAVEGNFRAYWGFFDQLLLYCMVSFLDIENKRLLSLIRMMAAIYLAAMGISFFMVFAGMEEIPFFSSFSWRVRFSGEAGYLSVRVGILSVAGVALFQIALVFLRRERRGIRYALLVLSVFSVLISGGRAALLSILITTTAYCYYRQMYRVFLFAFSGAAVCIFLLILRPSLIIHTPPAFQRTLTMAYSPSSYTGRASLGAVSSMRVRIEAWSFALSSIKENPFIGNGYMGLRSSRLVKGQSGHFAEATFRTGTLHNAYVSMAAIFGIPAMVLSVYLLYLHILRGLKLYRNLADDLGGDICLWIVLVLVAQAGTNFFLGSTVNAALFMWMGILNNKWWMMQKSDNIGDVSGGKGA